MTAPSSAASGAAAPAGSFAAGTQESSYSDAEFQEAVKQAYATCAANDMNIGVRKLHALTRAWLVTRRVDEDFGRWLYRDPTGDEAVWRCLKAPPGKRRGAERQPSPSADAAAKQVRPQSLTREARDLEREPAPVYVNAKDCPAASDGDA